MSRFVYKKVSNKVSFLNYNKNSKPIEEQKENKEIKKEEVMMTTKEKISAAASILDGGVQVKKVKKDKGLIERTESSSIILTEDNKELLKD